MDALLSMPWLYETLAEGAEEEVTTEPTVDKVPDQEAMQTGRNYNIYFFEAIFKN